MSDTAPFHIAIDGPEAAGKGTVSRLVAERLGFVYIDTGAMYRMTALMAKQQGINFADEPGLVTALEKTQMDMRVPTGDEKDGRLITVLLNDEDVSWSIRTEEISVGASKVAQLAGVRKNLVAKQQLIAEGKSVVMEGRDITYRVLPNANLKIYLTGSDIVRAKRRHEQLLGKGVDVSFEEVYKELIERDKRDMTRANDPLQKVDDAWEVDTSDLQIEQVVEVIVARVQVSQAAQRQK